MLIDVWPVTIITRVEAFFGFLGGKGAPNFFFTYIFVIREPQSMTYQKFLHSDRVPLREAFIRKNRKYIGDLPIGGYPPLARIGNFRFFPWAFLVIFFIMLKSSSCHEKDSV